MVRNSLPTGWDGVWQELPSIRYLGIHVRTEDVVSFPEPGLLPSSLVKLYLGGISKSEIFGQGLEHLISLEELRHTRK